LISPAVALCAGVAITIDLKVILDDGVDATVNHIVNGTGG